MGRVTRRGMTQGIGAMAALALTGRSVWAGSATPAQVEGPFHPVVDQLDKDLDLVRVQGRDQPAEGAVILVRGRVLDSSGMPLPGAMLDVWQANHHGRYSHPADKNTAPLDPNFQGWGVIQADADGAYALKTILPGPYPLSFLGEDGWRCRHIHFKVSHPEGRALTTQMYFEGDPLLTQDLEIAKVPADQQHRLICRSVPDQASGLPSYTFDIVLDAIA